MTSKYLINGSSSLLFTISTIKAYYSSNLICWKLSNFFLIFASFFCNAMEYKNPFLLIDYFAIFLVSISYINHSYINFLYIFVLLYEYKKTNSFENIKNIAFIHAVIKAGIYTYIYVNLFYLLIFLLSALSSIITYIIRYQYHRQNNKKNTIILTYLFHICIMSILYISSMTAI